MNKSYKIQGAFNYSFKKGNPLPWLKFLQFDFRL